MHDLLAVATYNTETWTYRLSGVGSFTKWGAGRPRDAESQHDCVMIVPYSGFIWQDMPCAFSVGYVCQTGK